MTNEQALTLKTNHSVWAWHQNALTSYDWHEAIVTKEPDATLQDVVVDVWIQDPPFGSGSDKTASYLEDRDPARRRTDKPHGGDKISIASYTGTSGSSAVNHGKSLSAVLFTDLIVSPPRPRN